MPEQPLQDKQSSLFEKIKLMKSCPLCSKEYVQEAISVVEETKGTHLIHLTCTYCSNAMIALILVSKMGMSSVAMLTDLSALDARRLYRHAPLGEDTVLNFHDYLKKDSKEFIQFLTS